MLVLGCPSRLGGVGVSGVMLGMPHGFEIS